jgi:hypothetical protein
LAWQFRVTGAEVPGGVTTKDGVILQAKPLPGATLATRFVCPLYPLSEVTVIVCVVVVPSANVAPERLEGVILNPGGPDA